MKLTRSAILFAAGVIGITSETVYSLQYHETPDPTLLILFAAMLGLPIYLSQDARGNNERRSRDTESPKTREDDDPDPSARARSSDLPKS